MAIDPGGDGCGVLVRGLWDCTANSALNPKALTGTKQGFRYLIARGFRSFYHGTHGTHGNGSPSVSRPVKWVCDPFADAGGLIRHDHARTRTASEGHATTGKKRGDAPRAALRFALGYLIVPLWGGGNEKTRGQSVFIIVLWSVSRRFR
jgi:hypothetical protein